MVNLKKIGVIAASALFLGATVGMAGAASFSSSMLVDGGVAKAKVVTGTANPDATGLTADEASAKVITDAVAAKYTTTSGGAGITFKYDHQDIDDKDTGEYNDNVDGDDVTEISTNSSGWDEKWIVKNRGALGLNMNTHLVGYATTYLQNSNNTEKYGIMKDGNTDGDVSDSNDYPLYNDIQIVDATLTDITVKPTLRVGNASYLKNKVIKLKGDDYLVQDYSDGTSKVTLVPVSEKTISKAANTGDLISSAVTIPGTDKKIGMTNLGYATNRTALATWQDNATFAVIISGAIDAYEERDSTTSDKTLELDSDLELLSGYYTYVTAITSDSVTLAIGKEADKVSYSNGDTDRLGYAKVVVNDDDGWTTNGDYDDEFRFEDSEITIATGGNALLGDTYVSVVFTSDKEFDLVTEKTEPTDSGSEMKHDQDPWNDILNIKINEVAITGGTTEAVTLVTLKDTAVTAADKSDYNLVLVGGPVANVLTAELLTATGATGTVEVVSDAFNPGKYAIVVAGATRTETATAATALAAMV